MQNQIIGIVFLVHILTMVAFYSGAFLPEFGFDYQALEGDRAN